MKNINPATDLIIDLEQFNMCADYAPEAIRTFEKGMSELDIRLSSLIATGEKLALDEELHSLKGMALNLGYKHLANTCSDICMMCKSSSYDIGEIKTEVEQIPPLVKGYIQKANNLLAIKS